jgi:hypothetical protein
MVVRGHGSSIDELHPNTNDPTGRDSRVVFSFVVVHSTTRSEQVSIHRCGQLWLMSHWRAVNTARPKSAGQAIDHGPRGCIRCAPIDVSHGQVIRAHTMRMSVAAVNT